MTVVESVKAAVGLGDAARMFQPHNKWSLRTFQLMIHEQLRPEKPWLKQSSRLHTETAVPIF